MIFLKNKLYIKSKIFNIQISNFLKYICIKKFKNNFLIHKKHISISENFLKKFNIQKLEFRVKP